MLTLQLFLLSSQIPNVDGCRRAASASRSARKAAAVVRGAPRADLDPNYRGRLRVIRPPNAPAVGPSPVVHTGLSVNSSLPSSTPSSARLPHRVPQPVPLWERPASFFTATPAAEGYLLCWQQLQLQTLQCQQQRLFQSLPPPPPPQMVLCKLTHHPLTLCLKQRLLLIV